MTPLRIGLTGGVGSGKSTVAHLFSEYEVPVFSADAVAHELTAPGAPLLKVIRERFGDAVFTTTGALDRAALAQLVFGDAAARSALEAVLHPAIRTQLRDSVEASDADYCVVEIPLLSRADIGRLVDRVLVVDAPPELQRTRLLQRDGRTREDVDQIIAAQLPRAERLELADDVICNDGATDLLLGAVKSLDALYRDIAVHGDPGRPGLRLPAEDAS